MSEEKKVLTPEEIVKIVDRWHNLTEFEFNKQLEAIREYGEQQFEAGKIAQWLDSLTPDNS